VLGGGILNVTQDVGVGLSQTLLSSNLVLTQLLDQRGNGSCETRQNMT